MYGGGMAVFLLFFILYTAVYFLEQREVKIEEEVVVGQLLFSTNNVISMHYSSGILAL